MSKELREEEMKIALEALFKAIVSESGTYGEAVVNISNTLKEQYQNVLKGPEEFSALFIYKVETIIESVAEQFYNKGENKMEDKYKPTFIFTNYGFLENHIESLVKKREGFGCSADKSRHILNKYLKYALTGEVKEFNVKKR